MTRIVVQPLYSLFETGFSEVDCAGSHFDRRPTSGYYTFIGGNLVTWCSKKHNAVTYSNVEAKY